MGDTDALMDARWMHVFRRIASNSTYATGLLCDTSVVVSAVRKTFLKDKDGPFSESYSLVGYLPKLLTRA